MKVYRMTFDIAVSQYCHNDGYDLETLISKAICSAPHILAAEGRRENCLICNGVDASKIIDEQKDETK